MIVRQAGIILNSNLITEVFGRGACGQAGIILDSNLITDVLLRVMALMVKECFGMLALSWRVILSLL